MTKFGHAAVIIMLVGTTGMCEDFDTALSRARESAHQHRFGEAIEILLPYSGSEDPEIRYITAAELGRAYFHLGRYEPANRAFREAVAIHPERPETAIYLEASSYLTGDTRQAFLIFEELLRNGARDLYLTVTLPGSRRFLAEPTVQALLARYAIPLEVDVHGASAMGVALGDSREAVVKHLAAAAADPAARTLTAEAGPAVIWAFAFDDQRQLSEIVLYAGNLLEFTPYRLRFAAGIDWTATPAAAVAVWGSPSTILSGDASDVGMTWDFGDHDLTVSFGPGSAVRPPDHPQGAAMIRTVRLRTVEPTP